jgi:hypothetical protein
MMALVMLVPSIMRASVILTDNGTHTLSVTFAVAESWLDLGRLRDL